MIAEAAWSTAQPRLTARVAVYDPTRRAERLLWRVVSPSSAARLARPMGILMRAAYGPAWGVASAALIPDDTATSKAVVGVAAAVWGFELAALPLT